MTKTFIESTAHDVVSCGYAYHNHDHTIKNHNHNNSLHDTHTHSISARIADAEQECQIRGVRWTPLRSEVLKLILEVGKPIGAYDLLAKMAHQGRPPAPPTVYRTLDFLLEQGFIHRLTSINSFVPCCHPRQGHEAAFLICQNCHRVDEAESSDLQSILQTLANQGGFVPKQATIEIAGLCIACQTEQIHESLETSTASSSDYLDPPQSVEPISKAAKKSKASPKTQP